MGYELGIIWVNSPQISDLHGKYLAQGRELGEAEKLSQSADNMRGLVERLTIENEELTRQNNQLSLQTAEFETVSVHPIVHRAYR